MKTTVCCQGTGITLSDCSFSSCRYAQNRKHAYLQDLYSTVYVHRYQNSDTEYETPKGYHHPDIYYDDDEQPLYHDSRRSPKRRLLPATPQGVFLHPAA